MRPPSQPTLYVGTDVRCARIQVNKTESVLRHAYRADEGHGCDPWNLDRLDLHRSDTTFTLTQVFWVTGPHLEVECFDGTVLVLCRRRTVTQVEINSKLCCEEVKGKCLNSSDGLCRP